MNQRYRSLTPAQRAVLTAMEQGARLMVWMGFTVRVGGERVHRNTFYGLNTRRLIERDHEAKPGLLVYRISPAGRAALEES